MKDMGKLEDAWGRMLQAKGIASAKVETLSNRLLNARASSADV